MGRKEISISEIGGFRIGHAQDKNGVTGCTVLLFDECAPAGVDIRGGGPASRETPLLNPAADAAGIHAVLLSGGSAFGLDAAGGVMQYLEERNIGFDVGVTKVPLVCQSCIFDLVIGDAKARPDSKMAYEACENARREETREGCIGAGMGCTVGKYRGKTYAMKSGIGMYAMQAGEVKVGAIVAVNALGDIFDIDTGKQTAGLLNETRDGFRQTEEEMYKDAERIHDLFTGNTTIGVIVTNGAFTKTQMNKIASMAHNGYARTIRPVHTTADGDSIYAVSVGKQQADLNVVGTMASYVMGKAVNRAVMAAEETDGYLSASQIQKK
ncbi:MAG: P1 family peptidase [Eubacteriales bacterium]|nr:P1 family peptidase [Eubacteriales bacterium]